jgi:hypothetical protein
MFQESQIERKTSFRAVAALSAGLLVFAPPYAAAQETRLLKIEVLSGEGAFNSIKEKRSKDIEIRVLDQSDKPVTGAAVLFELPALGASGTFSGGKTTFMTTTTNTGQASTMGLRPNNIEGRFNTAVTVSYQGLEARATVAQTNTLAGGQVGVSSSHKKYWIIGIIGGAAAAGILAGTRSGSSTPAPGSTVSIGAISVGAPR